MAKINLIEGKKRKQDEKGKKLVLVSISSPLCLNANEFREAK